MNCCHKTWSVNQDSNLEPPANEVGVLQGGSNMTGTDLCVNKLHCAAAVRP